MFEIYLWADGKKFDAASFRNSILSPFKGTVESRKRSAKGVETFWKSEVRKSIGKNPDAELFKLLTAHKSDLLRARTKGANRIFAEIVAEWNNLNEVGGFYFSAKIIRLLSEIGASVDIDIYERFSQNQRYMANYDIGDTVRLVKIPGWVESLPPESKNAFRACMNRACRVTDITTDGHLVLDVDEGRGLLLGRNFRDIRVEPKYVSPG